MSKAKTALSHMKQREKRPSFIMEKIFFGDSMRPFIIFCILILMTTLACAGGSVNTPAESDSPVEAVVTESISDLTEEAVTPTATLSPANVIYVDTLEQEVYPFEQHGKCSFAEAIMAANTGKQLDTCNTGVLGDSVIELMPVEYVFTQVGHSAPVYEWLISVTDVGTALPSLAYPMTMHGNGAILTRDENAEAFRFFEIMINAMLMMDNI